MRKLIFCMHLSLDGLVSTPDGGLRWVTLPEELFDFTDMLAKSADTAVYGRNTFRIMDEYWPEQENNPGASRHDKNHSKWYRSVRKYVVTKSSSVKTESQIEIIGQDLEKEINAIRQEPGTNIMLFGSPSLDRSLLEKDLVDEFYLFVNPVLLGNGPALFGRLDEIKKFTLVDTRVFNPGGVVGLHYAKA